jgi:glycosyltransferase involved in cell wall biosynthesis
MQAPVVRRAIQSSTQWVVTCFTLAQGPWLMRILFLLTQDLESPAGLGRYFPLARELASLGHQVSIAALHAAYGSLQEARFQLDGVDVWYVAQMHVRKHANVKLYYPTHRLVPLMARATWALTRAALTLPADVVHIGKPHPMNSVAGLVARYVRGKRVLLDYDDYEAASNRFGGVWQRRVVALFEDNVPRHVHQVTTHTRFLRDRLQSLGISQKRITCLPNGVDRRRFSRTEPAYVESLRSKLGLAGKKTVAFIGTLSSPSHALDLLLDAFARVRLQRADSVLLIVGGGEEYGRLQDKVQRMGLSEATVFCGRIPGAQVPTYYRLADVVMDPVYDNDVGQSRMPLKLFESWASGIPFVTGDVGDRRAIMGSPPAGVLVQPGDPTALSAGILEVLSDSDLAMSLRTRGLERVEDYYWDHLVQGMEGVYSQVMSQPR